IVRNKKACLTLNFGANGLKVDSKPTPNKNKNHHYQQSLWEMPDNEQARSHQQCDDVTVVSDNLAGGDIGCGSAYAVLMLNVSHNPGYLLKYISTSNILK
ncbi:hypothetical protein J6590_096025, partial [Homalodisca vitripennis]